MKLISKEEDKNVFVQIEKRTFRVFCGFLLFLVAYIAKLIHSGLGNDPTTNLPYFIMIGVAICGGLYLVIFTATRTLELESVHGKLIYTVSRIFRTTRAEFPTSSVASVNIFSTSTDGRLGILVGAINKSNSVYAGIFFTDGTKLKLERLPSVVEPQENFDVSKETSVKEEVMKGVVIMMANAEVEDTVAYLNRLSLRLNVPFINVLA